jgi:amino acid adenylation domain-containing protein
MGDSSDNMQRSCQQPPDDPAGDQLFHLNTFFPTLIEAHARLQPSRVCLVASSGHYDFASLWSSVLLNTRQLVQQGLTPGSRVAIVAESSPAAIVALLAVLQVGAVAVPLNSSLPDSHIQTIVRSGRLTHLIALATRSEQLNLAEVDGLTLNLTRRGLQPQADPDQIPNIDPQAPAIVIFTSGSTGEPKGVVHSHASLSTMAVAVGKALDLTSDVRNFLFPSFGWAVNIIDSFSTLAAGGCLCIPTEAEKSHSLEDTISRFNATRTTLPSSVLRIMSPSTVPTLTRIVVAGEPMRSDVALAWAPHVELYWNYGSSETMMVLAGKTAEQEPAALNAGHPLACCRCSIVDDTGMGVPPGKAGQLMVESHTNFMGYLRDGKICRPEKEHNSHPVVVGSGDLFAQPAPNAALVHHGRIDSQLKIAGQRFEPQEVEEKLSLALADVKELAVTVATLKDNARGPALVVVVALERKSTGDHPSETRLKCSFELLVQTLPRYMIPIGALEVDKLPRLHNGKLDRKVIVQLAEQHPVTDLMDLRPPRKESPRDHDIALATQVAVVWAKVLGSDVADIKPSSSFFLLGGNSLYAIRACKELRRIGVLLSMSDFFLHPTLGEMVRLIMEQDKSRSPEPSNPLRSTRAELPGNCPEGLFSTAARECAVDESLIEDVYPCTAMQTALMTLSEMHEGTYVAGHTFYLPPSWTRPVFRETWLRVLAATPILRTRIIRHHNGGLYNVTLRVDASTPLLAESWPASAPLGCGSPLFVHFLDTDPGNGRLIWRWIVHHGVYDRWSTHLILDLTRKLYDQESPVPSTPFSRFAAAAVQQEGSEAAKSFWHSKFESFDGTLFPQLPLDHPVGRASRSITFDVPIPRRRSAITQATTIQGALSLLISKLYGESDVVFGMTVHGRTLANCPDAETVVGPAIATVPMRIRLEGSTPVSQFLVELQTQTALMSDYEHYGLQNIKSLGPGAAAAASFTTLLIIQPELDIHANDNAESIVEIDTGASDFYVDYPLVIECFPQTRGVTVKILYDPVVFPSWDLQMMAQLFEQSLHAMQSGEDSADVLKDVTLLGAASVPAVLEMSCGQLIERRECLHERIFAKAYAWADENALHGWDAEYTYGELRGLVQKLATCLVPLLPSTPGQIVPICYPKSAAAVVAMLATLTAGHAFLLLDPSLPPQRIQYMIQAVKADRVLCASATRRYVEGMSTRLINFQDLWEHPSASPDLGSFSPQPSPDTPAYCIFTSGSTGTPKGVLLLHRQVTSGLEAQVAAGLYDRQARLLQFSSYTFDTCIADIFATLLSGGCICVPRDEDRLLRISENINEFSATAIDLTPSVARMIQPDEVPQLKVLRLGGEAMHQWHIQTWADRCNLQNTYGPTECCVQCTFVDRVPRTMSPSIIGKGIGCNTWVVDPQNHKYLMPLGAVGELAIQGPSVASGYVNNTAKSKALFLSRAPWLDTYSVDCDYPVYLTGDLVKFNEQGDLIFLGRKDNQIKIRGQRVEPEEIEHLLQQDESTDKALVCYPTTGVLALQLVAIVEPAPPNAAAPGSRTRIQTVAWMERIAQKAAEFLPRHMVPGVFLLADQTLLTSSGKLDRRSIQVWLERLSADEFEALLAHQTASGGPGASTVASAADLPESLTAPIVRQIRSLLSWRSPNSRLSGSFSTRDSFSRIGLDSITIIPLLKWINANYHVRMDMTTLLRLETVHGLIGYLQSRDGGQTAKDSSDGKDHETFEAIIRQGVDQLCREPVASNGQTDDLQLMEKSHLAGSSILTRLRRMAVVRRCLNAAPGQRRLGRQLSFLSSWRKTPGPRRILLTGGTSLVGLNILTLLLQRFPSTRVAVLIRCHTAAAGKERLVERASLLRSWRRDFSSRIDIWPGDLSAERLGLSPAQWSSQLGGRGGDRADHVDAVIHNGAAVDWFEGFQTLKKSNIDAALQLVECVRDSPAVTRLVYISGGPQWDPYEPDTAALERGSSGGAGEKGDQSHLQDSLAQSNAYGQTKIITGAVLQRAAARSPRVAAKVAVLRPALIVGAAADGVPNIDDFIWRAVRGCYDICAFPQECPTNWVYLCGADIFADQVIARLTATPRVVETKVHCGLSVGRFWAIVNRQLKEQLERVDAKTWLQRLKKSISTQAEECRGTEAHPCQPILHMLESSPSLLGAPPPRACADPKQRRRLEEQGARVVEMNLRYMAKIGCFSEPEEAWSAKVFHRSKTR